MSKKYAIPAMATRAEDARDYKIQNLPKMTPTSFRARPKRTLVSSLTHFPPRVQPHLQAKSFALRREEA